MKPTARFGLTLLLQRGLWAWARAVLDTEQAPTPAAAASPSASSNAMTKLLAELIVPHIERIPYDAIEG